MSNNEKNENPETNGDPKVEGFDVKIKPGELHIWGRLDNCFVDPTKVDQIKDSLSEYLFLSRPSFFSIPAFLESEHGPTRHNLINHLYSLTPEDEYSGSRYREAVRQFYELTGIPQYDWEVLEERLQTESPNRLKSMMAYKPQREPLRIMSGTTDGIQPVLHAMERVKELPSFADIDSITEFEDDTTDQPPVFFRPFRPKRDPYLMIQTFITTGADREEAFAIVVKKEDSPASRALFTVYAPRDNVDLIARSMSSAMDDMFIQVRVFDQVKAVYKNGERVRLVDFKSLFFGNVAEIDEQAKFMCIVTRTLV